MAQQGIDPIKPKTELGVEGLNSKYPQTKEDFIKQVTPVAEDIAKDIGPNIEPEWVVNMWRHETGNGQSSVTQNTYNLGNIKGTGYKSSKNKEQDENGTEFIVPSEFRKYSSFEESGKDFAQLLALPRYKKAREATTKKEFYTALKQANYATDKNYVDKLLKY